MSKHYFLLGRQHPTDPYSTIRINNEPDAVDKYTSLTKLDYKKFFGEQITINNRRLYVTEIKMGWFQGLACGYSGPFFSKEHPQQEKTCPITQISTIDDVIVEPE